MLNSVHSMKPPAKDIKQIHHRDLTYLVHQRAHFPTLDNISTFN